MIGTWRDTLLNVVVFAYVGWLIWLWLRPPRGSLGGGERPEESQSRAAVERSSQED
jgi:hypothetical protein